MKKILIIILSLLLLYDNIAFGKSNYEREDEAYNLHMEAINEDNYSEAMKLYNMLTNKYADTEYYKDYKNTIEEEIEKRKSDYEWESEKKELEKKQEILEERKREQEKLEEQLEEAKEKEIREREDRFEKLIKEHKIAIGMTRAQVIESWGRPDNVNESYYGTALNEQWVYRYKGLKEYAADYVYFKDGRVSSWSSSE